ncbi:MAG: hypothetical protein WB660_16365 [Candidatus Sulfotelmatobacter sp.]
MRCGRCGNDNAEGNRFCGMCGALLAAKTQAPAAGVRPAPSVASGNISAPRPSTTVPTQSVPVAPVAVQPARPAPPASRVEPRGASAERGPAPFPSFQVAPDDGLGDGPDREPIISGPSFLGLNRPSAGRGGHCADGYGDRGRDHLRSSGNVDYLLDDDDEPRRGWGKLFLVLVALAFAGGFGYLHWKQGGFDWLKVGDKKPAATQPADAGQNDNGGAAGAAAVPAAATPDRAAPANGGTAAAPAAGTTATPTANGTGATPVESGAANPSQTSAPATSSSTTSSSPAASSSTAAASSQDNSAPSNSVVPQTTGSQPKAGDSSAPADAASETAGSDTDKDATDEEEPAAPKAAAPKAAATRPAAKPSAAKPVDSVAEAQRYVYGRGVTQDCDRGLRMLKSAAGQSDAKAMISLGALYSTGTCAPRDLPTSYRWFALALHKQPENQALQDDLQKLWSQMTQPERQLAIKLSQ